MNPSSRPRGPRGRRSSRTATVLAAHRTAAALALALGLTALPHGAPVAAGPSSPVEQAASTAADPVAFPGNDGKPHRVTWDHKSLKIDGERLAVWSGEFHYWRLPSPHQWRDVLQKLKASGFNAVSLYFFWGYHSSKPGSYDFEGIRDIDRLLTMAEEEGLYVIARPGPYINAEASMGGLPAYMTNHGGEERTADPQNLAADLEWLKAVNRIIGRHQITDGGGSVIAYQVENEQIDNAPKHIEYIEKLQSAVEEHGIDVPLFHNDWGDGHGWNVPGGPGGSKLDLYAFDTYPLGFDCAGSRGGLKDFESRIRSYSPKTPVFIAEGQGGAFTAWGRDFQTSECAKFADEAFTRQFAVNNLANGVTMFNSYMEYGGTNWGWTGDPGSGFTSYDYGAPISEDRRMRPKLAVHKEFGYLQNAVKPLASAQNVTAPETTATGGGPVKAQQRLSTENAQETSVSGNGMRLITLRHPDSNDTSTSEVSFPLDLAAPPAPAGATADEGGSRVEPSAVGYPRVPQKQGTSIRVAGRDAKSLVADYAFGPHRLVYSTSQLLTHLDAGGDLLVLDGAAGEDGETVLRYATEPKVTTADGAPVDVAWDEERKDLRLNYAHDGTRTLKIEGDGKELTVLITDRSSVATTWQLDSSSGQVLVSGPELARTARVEGGRLDLTGDTRKPTELRVFAPKQVDTLTWNGGQVDATRDKAGALVATLPGARDVSLPGLEDWRSHDSDPERLADYDDSAWTEADKTSADNPQHGPGEVQGVVLDTDEYGFHEGDTWYRGRYTPDAASESVTVHAKTGTAGHAMVWLNGHYLGRQGDGTAVHAVPDGIAEAGEPAVLSVLVRNMGHYEDWSSDGRSKTGRGLADVDIPGSGKVSWRIQGAAGGPVPVDTARGIYNNGGLYGERRGWHLPGAPDSSWNSTRSFKSERAGVRFYRTTAQLNLPEGQDTAIGLRIGDDSARRDPYRVQIFVNGWNTGQYVNNVGPQKEFVIPSGFLDKNGENTVTLAVSAEEKGVGPDSVELVNRGTVLGGVPDQQNDAPEYGDLRRR
ncbi:glycoside hydrolase family 35 protein [Streptomyces cavernicola]|uniref:beta-galactosidase n=1 Tax=Streptomyces cavernicola TaxID=3043613 RepID=A0ABT6SM99_9ACTN|nr:beta-galactosidase [Streptomyces sp. B-S-A6]MDI3408969.1 beta-galactosidase [Streptomyces sp. B-S-A6]